MLGTPRVLASSVVLAVTNAMFCERPSLMRLCTSSWALPNGIAERASHSCWVSCAVAFTSAFVLTTVASMLRSLAAIAAAWAPWLSWPPMIEVASPPAASAAAPFHLSASCISWPCC
jgi:hypothetical protein